MEIDSELTRYLSIYQTGTDLITSFFKDDGLDQLLPSLEKMRSYLGFPGDRTAGDRMGDCKSAVCGSDSAATATSRSSSRSRSERRVY